MKNQQMDLSTAEVIFELEGEYTVHDVRAAYKRLALKHHPDQNENSRASNYFMQQINEAYELLLKAANTEPKPGTDNYAQNDSQGKSAESYREGESSRQRRQSANEYYERKQREAERERQQAAERDRQERERREAERRKRQAEERERKRNEEQAKKPRLIISLLAKCP